MQFQSGPLGPCLGFKELRAVMYCLPHKHLRYLTRPIKHNDRGSSSHTTPDNMTSV